MEEDERNENKFFFVDGPGGNGKNFLYKALMENVRRKGLIFLATASSGIAATNLPGGRTAHSRFKISLKLHSNSSCNIDKQDDLAELLLRTTLIVWDEVPMTNKYAFEALDRTLRDINDKSKPFGGKIVVLGGDFRHVLPIVRKGTRNQQISASVTNATFWRYVEILRLSQNMRYVGDTQFSDYLLRVGDGTDHVVKEDFIKLPTTMNIPRVNESSIKVLIEEVFPNMEEHLYDSSYMVGRAIITPKNADVDKLNEIIGHMFPGIEKEYISWDSVEDDTHNLYQNECLNSISPSGLPPHRLILNVGFSIMLLRNLDPQMGLCNGTTLICRNLGTNFIDGEIVTGHFARTRIFLHRIPMKSEEDSGLPFVLTRNQFPIRVSFALTINKAQGQTIPNDRIFLRNHVFTHGQLYVALSRGVSESTTKILVKNNKVRNRQGIFTRLFSKKPYYLPIPQECKVHSHN